MSVIRVPASIRPPFSHVTWALVPEAVAGGPDRCPPFNTEVTIMRGCQSVRIDDRRERHFSSPGPWISISIYRSTPDVVLFDSPRKENGVPVEESSKRMQSVTPLSLFSSRRLAVTGAPSSCCFCVAVSTEGFCTCPPGRRRGRKAQGNQKPNV